MSDYGYSQLKTFLPDVAKDPKSIESFALSWAQELDGDTISTSVWDGDGLSVNSNSKTDSAVTVVLSGGTKGRHYAVENTITTSGGETLVKSLVVSVAEQ
tara:strand:+ start:7686 stop:7985 length:300 start_codon:yes stop_codon:yes gene_type:complete